MLHAVESILFVDVPATRCLNQAGAKLHSILDAVKIICLHAMSEKLCHVGIGAKVRTTLARANENKDWWIYCYFAKVLTLQARRLYANDDFGLLINEMVYAIDSVL